MVCLDPRVQKKPLARFGRGVVVVTYRFQEMTEEDRLALTKVSVKGFISLPVQMQVPSVPSTYFKEEFEVFRHAI